MPNASSTVAAMKLARDNNSKGALISFSFSASPAWVSSQQSVLNGVRGEAWS